MSGSSKDDGFKRFSVRVDRNRKSKYSMMRFNVPIELSKWNTIDKYSVELTRDMSKQRQFDLKSDELPTHGEGSEYRRREKEIARKMFLGHKIRKFDIEAQPWKLKIKESGKEAKKFTGTKEGGIGDSSMYFVMLQKEGGVFEATPVEEWHNFKPEIKHRTLTHEEAEAQWEKQETGHTIKNKFNFMNNIRLDDQIEGVEGSLSRSGRKKANDDLRIHGAEDERESSEDEFKRDRKKAKRGKKNVGGRTAATGEAIEDSDDGDDEGQEVDYMSDDSSDFDDAVKENLDEERKQKMKGVDEEIKSSSSEDEEDEEEKQNDKNEKDPADKSEESDSDIEAAAAGSILFKKKKSNSRSNTPTDDVIKKNRAPTPNSLKRVREESPSGSKRSRDSPTPGTGVTIEQVRAVLCVKPVTTKELLRKFKSKKVGLNQQQIIEKVGAIMRTLQASGEMKTQEKDNVKYHFIKEN